MTQSLSLSPLDIQETSFDREDSLDEKKVNTKEKPNRFFHKEEFVEILDFAHTNGFLSTEEKEKVLTSLNNQQAEEIAKLFLKMFPIFAVFDIELITAASVGVGTLTASPPIGIATYSVLTAVQAACANGFVHWQGRKIDKKNSIAKWAMIPHFGKYTPLVYLLRDHPEFLKFLIVYTYAKKTHRKKLKHEEGSPEHKEAEVKELVKIQKALHKFDRIEITLKRIKLFVKDTSLKVKNVIEKQKPRVRKLVGISPAPIPIAA